MQSFIVLASLVSELAEGAGGGGGKTYQAFYGLKYYNLEKTEVSLEGNKKTNKLPYVAIKKQKALNNSDMIAC